MAGAGARRAQWNVALLTDGLAPAYAALLLEVSAEVGPGPAFYRCAVLLPPSCHPLFQERVWQGLLKWGLGSAMLAAVAEGSQSGARARVAQVRTPSVFSPVFWGACLDFTIPVVTKPPVLASGGSGRGWAWVWAPGGIPQCVSPSSREKGIVTPDNTDRQWLVLVVGRVWAYVQLRLPGMGW